MLAEIAHPQPSASDPSCTKSLSLEDGLEIGKVGEGLLLVGLQHVFSVIDGGMGFGTFPENAINGCIGIGDDDVGTPEGNPDIEL